VLPIADRHNDYGIDVLARLHDGGVRAELDERVESVGRKIRDAELRKIPYMLVVGDREREAGEVALREHRHGDSGSLTVEALIERLRAHTTNRSAR
jgi:threonyl-tRNA synthetase